MRIIYLLVAASIISSCESKTTVTTTEEKAREDSIEQAQHKVVMPSDSIPAPNATSSATKKSEVVGWKDGQTPVAPAGFMVTRFAENLQHPRWIYVAKNGDVFVSQGNKENSPDNIIMYRDANHDGIPESHTVFLQGLSSPFGMLIIGNKFYVANSGSVVVYPYTEGATSINESGKTIITLPAGGRHWTRNIISNKDGSRIYVSVGSSTNVAEDGIDKEERRAMILSFNADGSDEKVYASGLRNPCGMDWAPGSNVLWTAVNERDELGDDLPPDYLVGVKEGGFYGWPYAYYGTNPDPRLKGQRDDLVQKSLKPDVSLGAHTASLGLVFYNGSSFPSKYHGGAFIGQHGSWNRSVFSGYKVVFVPFRGGRPAGKPEDFLTGFIANEDKSEVYGRPVGVATMQDGSLLVADDGGNIVWRVTANSKK